MQCLQYRGEDECTEEADEGADDDLAHAMADALFHAGEFALVEVELFDEHVEVTALVAEIHTDTGSVVDEDEGKRERDREGTGTDSLVPADTRRKRYGERGVRARHMAVGEHIFRLPAMFHREDDEFECLCTEADDYRNDEDEIGRKGLHMLVFIRGNFTIYT